MIGTWILTSITSTKDGADIPQPDLQGVLTYTADGYFHFVSMRKDLPKIAANDRTKPTPEEAMAVASGALAYTGSYTVDEKTRRRPKMQVDGKTLTWSTPPLKDMAGKSYLDVYKHAWLE